MPKPALAERTLTVTWRGKQWDAYTDETPALCVEGALRSGKTTLALWKEITALLTYPGLHTLIARWTGDETEAILKPRWRELLTQAGIATRWNAMEQCDEFPNGSRAYLRSLKAQDQASRYGKLRGPTLARVYIDQAEEIPRDIYHELKARLSQKGFPHQIVITPQAVDEQHWIAKEFPADNSLPHRRYVSLSVYDNAHNLDAETIRNLEDTYPLGHPKRAPLIDGRRGMNVIGDPVFAGAFTRAIHERPIAVNPALPLEEAFDFGKHHPCWVARQVDPFGALCFVGGLQGEDMFLDDFLQAVGRYRAEWFPDVKAIQTCCDPAGAQANQGQRATGVEILRAHYPPGHRIAFEPHSNSPEVRLGLIEALARAMRQRTSTGEGFGIDNSRWLLVSPRRGVSPWPFFADGCESGYVWSDLFVSVNHKPMRQPKADGWYDHSQVCAQYLQLNFSPRRTAAPAPAAAPYRPTRTWG